MAILYPWQQLIVLGSYISTGTDSMFTLRIYSQFTEVKFCFVLSRTVGKPVSLDRVIAKFCVSETGQPRLKLS
jgi:hypothetical protein